MPIRDARPVDAERIAEIYNDAVQHTTAIWNDETVDAANRRGWIADRQAHGFPVIVAVDADDDVLGYASFGPWRAFDGYRHTVEHSVYVRGDQRGAGLGPALMAELVERARQRGTHVMVAGIDAENAGSIRLHERMGFAATGTLRQVGMKFGRWLDLTFMQLVLDDREAPPRG
ncbi:phosphinothricin acetyltransferase [Microbacterium marinum]|uniref:Phosphinothricin acetyltransferase n=1 Tax=Microbacterium marinum TaxID=421115 RepID=A0A7W7BNE9_9MICO|nr:GNAT family N-acetyltransferase [Microbacterium marinum]MBB4665860.1 phosphinothricin acetyltransferase [Microbacterium marinum]